MEGREKSYCEVFLKDTFFFFLRFCKKMPWINFLICIMGNDLCILRAMLKPVTTEKLLIHLKKMPSVISDFT